MESTPSPKMVDPMVRVQSQRPAVAIFIFASTYEFTNSPQKYAIIEASAILQVRPKAISYASFFFQKNTGGRLTTTYDMNDANARPAKPHQITRRLLAYPYTSVSTSPNTDEIGKKSTPAPKVTAPMSGKPSCAIFAGPIRFEQINIVTNADSTNS